MKKLLLCSLVALLCYNVQGGMDHTGYKKRATVFKRLLRELKGSFRKTTLVFPVNEKAVVYIDYVYCRGYMRTSEWRKEHKEARKRKEELLSKEICCGGL